VMRGILAGIAAVVGDSSAQKESVAAMVSDLRRLAAAERAYYAERLRRVGAGEFAGDPAQLGFSPSPGVTVQLEATGDGWSARARHVNEKKLTCAVYAGSIEPRAPATREGEVACG
jgi:hypothetical protein